MQNGTGNGWSLISILITGKMRSRSNSLEDVAEVRSSNQPTADTRKRTVEREDPTGRAERRSRHRELPDDTGTIQRNHRTNKNSTYASGGTAGPAKTGRREKSRDLSKDDLVFLLSLLEGELQVIITDLQSREDCADTISHGNTAAADRLADMA